MITTTISISINVKPCRFLDRDMGGGTKELRRKGVGNAASDTSLRHP
jgi:hypothetical protein